MAVSSEPLLKTKISRITDVRAIVSCTIIVLTFKSHEAHRFFMLERFNAQKPSCGWELWLRGATPDEKCKPGTSFRRIDELGGVA